MSGKFQPRSEVEKSLAGSVEPGREKSRKLKDYRAEHAAKILASMPAESDIDLSDLEEQCRTLIPGYDPWDQCNGYRFSLKHAEKHILFFETRLVHIKGAKALQPFVLEPWQRAVIGNLFGWIDPETELRRYLELLLYVPRKQGKTPLAGGIVDDLLFNDGEPMAEIVGVASTFAQACYVFDWAAGFVRNNAELKDRCNVYGESPGSVQKAIQLTEDYSSYRVSASDGGTLHGGNLHGAVVDELHRISNPDMIEVLKTGTAARKQPLICYLTTADWEREDSVCNKMHDRACNIRDGIWDDPRFLPVIYEATKDDDWQSEKVWRQVMPNLDVSVDLEFIQRECQQAIDDPAYENTFKRLYCNIRTEQDCRWIPLHDWDLCVGSWDYRDLEHSDPFAGQECTIGLDLASRVDMSAAVLVMKSGEKWIFRPFFFMPKEQVMRDKKRRAMFTSWAKAGLLEMIPGKVMNFAWVRDRLLKMCDDYSVNAIAFDPWNAKSIADQMADDHGVMMVEVRQTMVGLNEASRTFEAAVASGNVEHGGHPIMRWMIKNVGKDERRGLMMPSKARSSDRIDGVVAAVTGLALAIRGIGEVSYADDEPMVVEL